MYHLLVPVGECGAVHRVQDQSGGLDGAQRAEGGPGEGLPLHPIQLLLPHARCGVAERRGHLRQVSSRNQTSSR